MNITTASSGAAPPSEVMDERVGRLKTPKDCATFIKNAIDRQRPDLAHQARRRATQLRTEGNSPETPLERAWFEALYAQEEAEAYRSGKPVKSNPRRSLLRKYGARTAIARSLAPAGDPSSYQTLKEIGLHDLSFENAVMRFPDEFDAEVLAQAKATLTAAD